MEEKYKEEIEKLKKYGQEEILEKIKKFNSDEQEKIFKQLIKIN